MSSSSSSYHAFQSSNSNNKRKREENLTSGRNDLINHPTPQVVCPDCSVELDTLVANTEKNPNRAFYKCKGTCEKTFKGWVDERPLVQSKSTSSSSSSSSSSSQKQQQKELANDIYSILISINEKLIELNKNFKDFHQQQQQEHDHQQQKRPN